MRLAAGFPQTDAEFFFRRRYLFGLPSAGINRFYAQTKEPGLLHRSATCSASDQQHRVFPAGLGLTVETFAFGGTNYCTYSIRRSDKALIIYFAT